MGQGQGGGPKPTITTEWADNIAKDLPRMYENGESTAEVCVKLGICKQSYYKAKRISEKFAAADQHAETYEQAWWEGAGRKLVTGSMRGSAKTWQFNMMNRFGKKLNVNISDVDTQPTDANNPGSKPSSEMSERELADMYYNAVLNNEQ